MKRNFGSAVLFGLLIGSAAHAANPLPVPLFTFTCKGKGTFGGHCPSGGRPDWIIQGSDGNFYGAAWDSQEGSSQPQGGTIFTDTQRDVYPVAAHPWRFPRTNAGPRRTQLPCSNKRLTTSKRSTFAQLTPARPAGNRACQKSLSPN